MTKSDIALTFRERLLFFKVRDGEGGSDRLVLKETFDENTYNLSANDFTESKVFVDLGANIGSVSILAKTLGAEKLYCFEPEPENRECMEENFKMNKIDAIIRPEAVWKENTTIEIAPQQGGTSSRPESLKGQKVITVKAISLAEALKDIPEVAVLKCDVEGAEYAIFLDIEANKKAKKIVMEFHKATEEEFGRMVATLVLTHNVRVFGRWDNNGGQLEALRY